MIHCLGSHGDCHCPPLLNLALVVAETLEPLTQKSAAPMRLLAAAKLGTVRLLDNMAVPD